jgi:hypothetical protein
LQCLKKKKDRITRAKRLTRFIYDQFAKDYLEQLLLPYGTVELAAVMDSHPHGLDSYPYKKEFSRDFSRESRGKELPWYCANLTAASARFLFPLSSKSANCRLNNWKT